MNNIIMEDKLIIDKNQDIFINDVDKLDIEILENIDIKLNIFSNNCSGNINIKINNNSNCVINLFGRDVSYNINVSLDKMSNLKLNYSSIAYKSTNNFIKVFHLGDKSKSEVFNHIVNCSDNMASLNIDLSVPKDINGCVCLQDNKIINLEDGMGKILPNLLIDSFDTFAEHSAYISKFNKDDLFYLMSRGLDINSANLLLVKAFLIGKMDINEEFKDKIIKEIELIRG